MRRFFWSGFDNPDDRTFMWWVFVGCLLYLLELRKMLLDDGFSGYFFHSQDSTWNKFDWVGVTFSGSAKFSNSYYWTFTSLSMQWHRFDSDGPIG